MPRGFQFVLSSETIYVEWPCTGSESRISRRIGNNLVQEVINKGEIVVALQGSPKASLSRILLKKTSTLSNSMLPSSQISMPPSRQPLISLAGCFEELTENQMRKQMEVNFFGLIAVTKKAVEVMREVNKPSGGLIQQVTSIGGQTGVLFFSIYCASK